MKSIELAFPFPPDSREFIFWLFKDRCIMCFRTAVEINEIVPRSRSKDALFWKNRVPMCMFHHEMYHKDGLTREKLNSLQHERMKFLAIIGRGEYI